MNHPRGVMRLFQRHTYAALLGALLVVPFGIFHPLKIRISTAPATTASPRRGHGARIGSPSTARARSYAQAT